MPREHAVDFVTSIATACQATDLELVIRYLQPDISTVETTGPPKFLGNPNIHLHMFFDPGRTTAAHQNTTRRAAPAKKTTKAPTNLSSYEAQ
jgi:hypothetical protein